MFQKVSFSTITMTFKKLQKTPNVSKIPVIFKNFPSLSKILILFKKLQEIDVDSESYLKVAKFLDEVNLALIDLINNDGV